jgi:hypothetical protein
MNGFLTLPRRPAMLATSGFLLAVLATSAYLLSAHYDIRIVRRDANATTSESLLSQAGALRAVNSDGEQRPRVVVKLACVDSGAVMRNASVAAALPKPSLRQQLRSKDKSARPPVPAKSCRPNPAYLEAVNGSAGGSADVMVMATVVQP